jgi:hypothetical protein
MDAYLMEYEPAHHVRRQVRQDRVGLVGLGVVEAEYLVAAAHEGNDVPGELALVGQRDDDLADQAIGGALAEGFRDGAAELRLA